MSIFDKIGEKAASAAQTAAKKSSDLLEISKINREIGKEQDTIDKMLFELGQKYYLTYREEIGADNQFKNLFDTIKQHEKNIKLLSEKIEQYKNSVKCSNCGSDLEPDCAFCTGCGAKIGETGSSAKCSNCGSDLESDSAFCTGCGQKI